jgi:hypothetical protein
MDRPFFVNTTKSSKENFSIAENINVMADTFITPISSPFAMWAVYPLKSYGQITFGIIVFN